MQLFRGLEDWGRACVSGTLARVLSVPKANARDVGTPIAQNGASKVLLVGLYQKMGQFLCTTPLIRALAAAWPNASLYFLGNPASAAAARANPHLERVWIWDKSAFWEWPGQLHALRKEQFDLALMLTTDRPSVTGVFIARATGAKKVAGYVPSISVSWAKSTTALYHVRIPADEEKNEVKRYLGLARALGVPSQGLRLEIAPTTEDLAAADAFIASQNVSEKGPWVGLFIGGKAEREDRLWPVSHFVQLASALKEAGLKVVAISPPPPEHARLEEFQKSLAWKCPVYQEVSVLRVAAFLKKLDLLVCPDGGILHLAAAVGTPTLALFFSTDPAVWRHDVPQTIFDGRGKPSSALLPEIVAAEAQRFFASSARR